MIVYCGDAIGTFLFSHCMSPRAKDLPGTTIFFNHQKQSAMSDNKNLRNEDQNQASKTGQQGQQETPRSGSSSDQKQQQQTSTQGQQSQREDMDLDQDTQRQSGKQKSDQNSDDRSNKSGRDL